MMSVFKLCLLLAIGAILSISVNGATTAGALGGADTDADARNDAYNVWDAFKPHSRAKREGPILGPIGWVIGKILLFKAKILTYLFDAVDIPLRWGNNQVAAWANYFDGLTPGNNISWKGKVGNLFG